MIWVQRQCGFQVGRRQIRMELPSVVVTSDVRVYVFGIRCDELIHDFIGVRRIGISPNLLRILPIEICGQRCNPDVPGIIVRATL